MPVTIPSTAASSGASSKTMLAALPPSSIVSFLPLPATERRICLPTSVEPVNAILSTPGWATSAAPVSPAPVTMFTTPSGSPACWHTCASSSAVSGVVSAGLSTQVLPAASAGASFHAAISSGKFHGMTWPATPTGPGRAPRHRVLELVRPAGVVEEVRAGQRHVYVTGFLDRLAVVDALQHGELAGALGDEPGDAVDVLGPLGARHRAPDVVEGRPGGAHGPVHVRLAGQRDLGQRLLGRGVDRGEGAPVGGRGELPVHEQPVGRLDRDDVPLLRRGRVLPGNGVGHGMPVTPG